MIANKVINSLENYIAAIRSDRLAWGQDPIAWFRGEPKVETPLLPKVFRKKPDGRYYDENQLLQMFRLKARSFSRGNVPGRESTDEWLFLAQHVGLPTRLLDWTENSLVALYFALENSQPVVWMLNPLELNQLSISNSEGSNENENKRFPLTWFSPEDGTKNIGVENIRAAWEPDYGGSPIPLLSYPHIYTNE